MIGSTWPATIDQNLTPPAAVPPAVQKPMQKIIVNSTHDRQGYMLHILAPLDSIRRDILHIRSGRSWPQADHEAFDATSALGAPGIIDTHSKNRSWTNLARALILRRQPPSLPGQLRSIRASCGLEIQSQAVIPNQLNPCCRQT